MNRHFPGQKTHKGFKNSQISSVKCAKLHDSMGTTCTQLHNMPARRQHTECTSYIGRHGCAHACCNIKQELAKGGSSKEENEINGMFGNGGKKKSGSKKGSFWSNDFDHFRGRRKKHSKTGQKGQTSKYGQGRGSSKYGRGRTTSRYGQGSQTGYGREDRQRSGDKTHNTRSHNKYGSKGSKTRGKKSRGSKSKGGRSSRFGGSSRTRGSSQKQPRMQPRF